VIAVPALLLFLAGAPAVDAHGGPLPPAPDAAAFILGWSFDATIWLPIVAAACAYLWAVRRVNAEHPANPVPADRPAFFLLGLAAIAIALQSGIERYDTTLFSVHMVQHVILIFVAAPAIVLSAPITLVLRVASPGLRRRWVLPVLNSRVVRVVGHPLVAWALFLVVMWGTHFSPLFDAALQNVWLHDLEHVLYLAASMLFWWPIVGRDPSPWRMGHPARLLFLFAQMPFNSFLGVAILFSGTILYPHYATTGRLWGPSPLEDQQAAGAIMWGLGDAGFLLALLLAAVAWMRHDEADTRRRETAEDARAADIAAEDAATGRRGSPPPAAATAPDAPAALAAPGVVTGAARAAPGASSSLGVATGAGPAILPGSDPASNAGDAASLLSGQAGIGAPR
jgi:cytochrome c oxidase assembly factor CtaG